MTIFDTHAHYDDSRFDGDRDELLSELPQRGVCKVINIGCDVHSSQLSLDMADRYGHVYAAVGIHPQQSGEAEAGDIDRLRQLARHPKAVAIGEIGLDYHWQSYGENGEIPMDKEKQAFLFDSQMSLARRIGLPVVIHDRDAHGDVFEMICRYPEVRGILHSYSGSPEMARELLRRGWYISFSGVVTFKNARNVKAAAAVVPLDRFLLETDAPYLAPEPWRGKLNRSDYIASSVRTLAEIHGVTEDEIIDYSHRNACKLFSV